MRKEDPDFATISTPLPRVFAQITRDIKNTRLKKRICEKTTRNPRSDLVAKYTSANDSQFQDIAFDLLLSYRLYDKNVTKIVRKHYLAIDLENKYEILYTELRNRLHVDDPLDDVRAVTDIDDEYFRYLNNYAGTVCIPLYKSLKFLYHKQIRTKQEIGYRQDDVLNIETNHRKQLRKQQESVQIYMEQVKQFEAFVSEDYEKSITCLKKSETLFSELIEAKDLELQNAASRQFSIQSKLLGMDYLYYQQQKYGRFLYYVSPPSWRARHRDFASSVEIEAKGFDLGTSNEEDTFNVIFENMKKECARGLVKPALYFTQAVDLKNIFESAEKQQLHHFIHVVQLKPQSEMIRKITNLKNDLQNDTAFIANIIRDIKKYLDFDEERASQLKARFMKILYGSFFDTVAATDVLQLKMNLEWCYEKIFNQKSNTTIGLTAKALEDIYMKYTYKLESFGHDETKAALKQSIAEDKSMMNKAHMAARELRLFDRLEKSLMRAHFNNNVVMAPTLVVTRPLTRKPKKHQNEPVLKHSIQRELSEAEIEYLHLFTNWTEKENPAKYLHDEDVHTQVS